MLKVELGKLQVVFKKYKDFVPRGFSASQIMLPDFLLMPGAEINISSEELFIEIGKIRNALVFEVNSYKQQAEFQRTESSKLKTQQFKQVVSDLKSQG